MLTPQEKEIIWLKQCLDGHRQTIARLLREIAELKGAIMKIADTPRGLLKLILEVDNLDGPIRMSYVQDGRHVESRVGFRVEDGKVVLHAA